MSEPFGSYTASSRNSTVEEPGALNFLRRRGGFGWPLMKYIAAYLLAQAGGDANPSKAKIAAILESVGIEVDDAALTAIVAKLQGQDTAALIEKGAASLTGGGGGAAVAPPAAEPEPEAAPAKEEKKEEEAVVELAGGFDDLFGDF